MKKENIKIYDNTNTKKSPKEVGHYLHEFICQELSAISMRIGLIQFTENVSMNDLKQIKTDIDLITQKVQELSKEVSDTTHTPKPISSTISEIISNLKFSLRGNLQFHTKIDHEFPKNHEWITQTLSSFLEHVIPLSSAKSIHIIIHEEKENLHFELIEMELNNISDAIVSDHVKMLKSKIISNNGSFYYKMKDKNHSVYELKLPLN